MNSITIVLRSGMGMQIDSVRPYLRNGMPIAIGRAGAVISHFADGDAHLALRTIAEFPCSEQDDLPAANMRQIALAALSGAGAGSEPGNPGREPVSGPGNAGERPHPAPGLVGDHTELRRIAIALKNPQLSGKEASNLMVRYEALTMPDHIIALIDGQAKEDSALRELEESLLILEHWIEQVGMTDGYVGVVEIEAVEAVINALRRQQAGGNGA
ncbi:hypothetical protein H2O03_34280 [Pseudomonas aeruginosa]|uniref:hypothetical protein n=1 Tax=Pseudomonas aeruginosa TaxID=287 RepID=UPI0015F0381E|nr:hypothetical protein [Pseudomonas aeruginosa]MBA4954009.1 hypothetical protein [Pseudomonas aeruginosa]